jgi:hypothetical protein
MTEPENRPLEVWINPSDYSEPEPEPKPKLVDGKEGWGGMCGCLLFVLMVIAVVVKVAVGPKSDLSIPTHTEPH